MSDPTKPQGNAHLASARAATDPDFRRVLEMVMEGRAPNEDYIDWFWEQMALLQHQEVDRCLVAYRAQKHEEDGRAEKGQRGSAEREETAKGAGKGRRYGGLGEGFEGRKVGGGGGGERSEVGEGEQGE